jgi:5'(3')-deoxyribonucleotidase
MKKILYVDMDNVLVDFKSGIDKLNKETYETYSDNWDEAPGIFSLMEPIKGAIESYKLLAEKYDTYILSTSPWNNPSAANDKVVWVQKYLGDVAHKRLILSHNKHLNVGDYLIDDRHDKNGVDKFTGEHIHFATDKFPDWKSVVHYLINK